MAQQGFLNYVASALASRPEEVLVVRLYVGMVEKMRIGFGKTNIMRF